MGGVSTNGLGYREGGAPPFLSEIRGAHDVAEVFKGRARGAKLALIDGAPGAAWAPGGVTRVVFAFSVQDEKIVEIDVVMEPARLQKFDVQIVSELRTEHVRTHHL